MRDIVWGIVAALLVWLERVAGPKVVDVRPDRPRLRLAGARLRKWLRTHGARR